MVTSAAIEIEKEFGRLFPEAQLNLLERLVHRVRLAVAGRQEAWEAELSAMATDEEVQRELHEINVEFHPAEADGLERR